MKSAYTLPVVTAAALHAMFFLGFENSTHSHFIAPVIVDEPEIPTMVIPLLPPEPPVEVDARPAADKSDPVDISDIAPKSDAADLPQRPGPESLPAVQVERVVLNTEAFT